MPTIYDNIETDLLPAVRQALEVSYRADFCVGYLNLRGWKHLHDLVERYKGGDGNCCRLLVGMPTSPDREVRDALSFGGVAGRIDTATALRRKKELAAGLKSQLTVGVPTDEDERALRRLAAQLRARKVVVKLYLRHPLHAKLYLTFRKDPLNPIFGVVGSSNLTVAGLLRQGELNVDVLDADATQKLAAWFEDRWNDRWCLDITSELADILAQSWAREDLVPPYYVYLKMAYHLSQEARAGEAQFKIPAVFGNTLFAFQEKAVQLAARHVHERGGVLIGDVVGLGKTLVGTALASILEDDLGFECLILCPKNLTSMWEDYRTKYRLRGTVLSLSMAQRKLPELKRDNKRYRLVLIDESHTLRNREGRIYRAVADYIAHNGSACIMLTATPYNKDYLDLSSQLRLFVDENKDLGVRPEALLRAIGETEFNRLHQCKPGTLAGFEHSTEADDWRELMRLYLVRRTRSFIVQHYAHTDPANGRRYLLLANGERSYFPARIPRTSRFTPDAEYAKLYHQDVVDALNALQLPRYGMATYLIDGSEGTLDDDEAGIVRDLSRAGRRLKGFCRTNLFKRLESCAHAFLSSVERHILRNFIAIHALENGLPVPIGTQDAAMLDTRGADADPDTADPDLDAGGSEPAPEAPGANTEEAFRAMAAQAYELYRRTYQARFRWLRAELLAPELKEALRRDAMDLMRVLALAPQRDPAQDGKLKALRKLLAETHPDEKVLIFTEFADTVDYLARELRAAGIRGVEGVTGDSQNPTAVAWRFSPVSNGKRNSTKPADEVRVLIATDVLSEGQNLQDCRIVVSFDLPWAIVRLIQRAGRVDRIGQTAPEVICYSFLPANNVERVIGLRARVRNRLRENAEVVGADEAFFEDDMAAQTIVDLYNERSALLDRDDGDDVDLASRAYQIWQSAIEADPSLRRTIEELPDVVYATRANHPPTPSAPGRTPLPCPDGALVYMRAADGNDALAWVDAHGASVTQSQHRILSAARCEADTPALPRRPDHHQLVKAGSELILTDRAGQGGQLGRPSGARFRTYERLTRLARSASGSPSQRPGLPAAIEEIYRHPLTQAATDALNRALRSGADDGTLADIVLHQSAEGRLTLQAEEAEACGPVVLCSMGLTTTGAAE